MLTLRAIKQLSKPRYPADGTKLIVTKKSAYVNVDDEVEFLSFNYFEWNDKLRFSHEMGFGRAGGASSWNDFSKRGRVWIKQHYKPELCLLIVNHPVSWVIGITADKVQLS